MGPPGAIRKESSSDPDAASTIILHVHRTSHQRPFDLESEALTTKRYHGCGVGYNRGLREGRSNDIANLSTSKNLRCGLVRRSRCARRTASSGPGPNSNRKRSGNLCWKLQCGTRQTVNQGTFHYAHSGSRRCRLPFRLGQKSPKRRRVQQSVGFRTRHEWFAQGSSGNDWEL